jgi:hypothetical protein
MNTTKDLSCFFFVTLILLYIFFTNTHLNYEESLLLGGADGKSYFGISFYAPEISKVEIQPIHSERFIFPYLIGIASNISGIKIFLLYKAFSVLLLFLINLVFLKISKKLTFSQFQIILCLCLINFNPYITRFYISNPTIITDLLFHFGLLICILGIVEKKSFLLLIGLIITIAARQSAIAILISFVFVDLVNKKFISKFKLNLLFVSVFFAVFSLNLYYSNHTISYDDERSSQYIITIFGLFMQNKTFLEILHFFIFLPALSFGPLFLIYIFKIKKIEINKQFKALNIFILTCSAMLIVQPFLSGVDVTGRNVMRLTTLAYIPIVIFFSLNIPINKIFPRWQLFFLAILFFIWSSHPTFSTFSFLKDLKF